MRLEDEIKQTKFSSEYQKLAVNIMFTHSWLVSSQKKIFSEYNITVTQYNILRILRGQNQNPISINSLRERMIDKMCDTSRLIERLRIKGFIAREACSTDRRKSDVIITTSGLELLKELDKLEGNFIELLNNLDSREAKNLNDLLDKLRN